MIDIKHCKALELDKVLNMLANHCTCEGSRKLAMELMPSVSYAQVVRDMKLTSDTNSLTARFGTPTVLNMKNCDNQLKRAEIGASLSLRELIDVCNVLKAIRNLITWKKQSSEMETSLDYMFSTLVANKALEDKLLSCIISDEEIADNASPELSAIRRKIRSTELNVRTQLDKMTKSTTYQKFLQEQIVTIRDGRFVVPVKAEYRNEVKGLVHDTSSSGATLFVEPMAIVEANNEIKVLKSKEQQEIDRIIAELSADVGAVASSIKYSYEIAVDIDLLFAKSRLADQMRASIPNIANDGKINLLKARHPLIDKEKIVPTDIMLGDSFDTLVITGPNTGGKTVALKTLGLLTLMAMCGLMLPVSDGSTISVFDKVLADIGDEQSIEQSLSTFSAHMTNIISILDIADDHTLVLMDELGAGTDPIEGAALAVAIVERLRALGAKIAATTHYAEIKMYALETNGVENASCEFDVATLRPTYKLLIGVPGRSNAFAISQRLGLDLGVIERAKDLVSSDNTRFEDVVTELERTRQGLEREKSMAQSFRLEMERAKEDAASYKEKLEGAAEKEIERARTQARNLVEQVKYQADKLMDELDDIRKQKDSESFSELAARAKAEYRNSINKLHDLADPVAQKKNNANAPTRKLKRGDAVLLIDINKEGTVTSDEDLDGFVQVQAGIIKTKTHVSELRLLDNAKKVSVNSKSVSFKGQSKVTRSGSSELDLRGMASDEALMDLNQYIDNAVMSGIPVITIIHGKGTGVLRTAVHQRLRQHKNIRTFRLGVYGEGESGVTIAELK